MSRNIFRGASTFCKRRRTKGFAIVSDALQRAWERAASAEQAKDLLLRELGHRTKNNLAMAISMLSMQASLKSNVETRGALEKAAARLYAIASAHEHFQPFEHKGRIEMRAYRLSISRRSGDVVEKSAAVVTTWGDQRPGLTPDTEIAKIVSPRRSNSASSG
jgi:two-component sensor histidine kinase